MSDLKLSELHVLDNGRPPQRVLAFDSMQDFPLHVGILIDTSQSIEGSLPRMRALADRFVQHRFRPQTDAGFVLTFGYSWSLPQSWTGSREALRTGIRSAGAARQNPLPGTALFDAVFQACFHEQAKADHSASGNLIIVFTDGEDNASHTALDEVVNTCQLSNTVIYAFRAASADTRFSAGPRNLNELAEKTGGRAFTADDLDSTIEKELEEIEERVRNQYRLVYRPQYLAHDGAFHRIEIVPPDRVATVIARSGYYAPKQ